MNWAEVWRRRSVLMYLLGVWTMMGSFFFSRALPDKPEEDLSGEQKGLTISEDGVKETTTYHPEGKSFTFVSTTIYKPNSVLLSTRLPVYMHLLFGGKEK